MLYLHNFFKKSKKDIEVELAIYKPIYDIYFRIIGIVIGLIFLAGLILYIEITKVSGADLKALQTIGFFIFVGILIMIFRKTEQIIK